MSVHAYGGPRAPAGPDEEARRSPLPDRLGRLRASGQGPPAVCAGGRTRPFGFSAGGNNEQAYSFRLRNASEVERAK